jgi:hypothetical protein
MDTDFKRKGAKEEAFGETPNAATGTVALPFSSSDCKAIIGAF